MSPEPHAAPTSTVGARACAPADPIAEGLRRCLALARHRPEHFAPAVAAWHVRWCVRSPQMTLADATAAATALDALPGPAPSRAARALVDVLRRQGRDDLARVVDEWLARPGG